MLMEVSAIADRSGELVGTPRRGVFVRRARCILNTVARTAGADEEQVRASYPAATLARLASVKGSYDPSNLFRLNHNIRPSTA
jgi:hypothetical protein